MEWNQTIRNEIKWTQMELDEIKRSEMKSNEMKWNEIKQSIFLSVGHPFYETYSSSKHAMEGLTESLAIRMKAFNVK